MKKLAALVLLIIGAIAVYQALSQPPVHPPGDSLKPSHAQTADAPPTESTPLVEPRLLSRLQELVPGYPESHAETVLADYGNTALDVARNHGATGLDGLRVLGTEGVAVMRSQPDTFSQLAERLGGERSIRLLALLKDHLAAVAGNGGLPDLMDHIEKLDGNAARLGDRYPQFLPLLVLAPDQVSDVLTLYPEIATECLTIVDLSLGDSGVRKMCGLIKEQAPIAKEWFAARGADGLMLAHEFPEFVSSPPPTDLEVFLQVLRTNSAYISSLSGGRQRTKAFEAITMLAEADSRLPVLADGHPIPADGLRRGLLLTLACEDPHTVRFVCDRGAEGIDILRSTATQWASAGTGLPRLLYDAYEPNTYPNAHRHAWESLLPHDTRPDAWFALQTFAPWKSLRRDDWHPKAADFVDLLGTTDGRFPVWAAQNELLRQSGPAGYAAADDDWALMRARPVLHLDDWAKKGTRPQEYLPLYDTCRLLYVLGSGYQPTSGELFFATVDVAFTAWDIATFGAGAIATEGIQASTKTLTKVAANVSEQAIKQTGRTVVESTVSRASKGILANAAKSPKLIKALGQRAKHAADASYWIMARGANAVDGAKALGITVRVGKYVAKETAINASVGQGIEQAMLFAERHRNEVVVKQVFEVLSFLNSAQDR